MVVKPPTIPALNSLAIYQHSVWLLLLGKITLEEMTVASSHGEGVFGLEHTVLQKMMTSLAKTVNTINLPAQIRLHFRFLHIRKSSLQFVCSVSLCCAF